MLASGGAEIAPWRRPGEASRGGHARSLNSTNGKLTGDHLVFLSILARRLACTKTSSSRSPPTSPWIRLPSPTAPVANDEEENHGASAPASRYVRVLVLIGVAFLLRVSLLGSDPQNLYTCDTS